jgi:hypothetical protein
MTRLVLHIEALVLRGVQRQDRATLADSLRQELAHALTAPDAAARLAGRGSIDRLHVPTVRVENAASPARLAQAVARGIGRGLQS